MSLLQSVDDIIRLFESGGCQYVVIGEIAVLLHGGRASTIDLISISWPTTSSASKNT